jgi:hypothetical protein
LFLKTDGAGNLSFSSDLPTTSFTGATVETSIAGGDLVLVYDDSATAVRKMTRTNFVAGVGGTNTPAFHATNSATQSLSSGSYTKVQFNTETFDTDSKYDNATNYRFTPVTTGRYFVYYRLGFQVPSTNAENKYPYAVYGRMYFNGSQADFGNLLVFRDTTGNDNILECYLTAGGVVDFTSASDYIELYAYSANTAGAGDTIVNTGSFFGAYKLIGV